MAKYISRRVQKTPQTGITSDRYEFLGLSQAEPNLGDPLVGPSSIGANPVPVGSYYQLAAIGEKIGERYWTTPVGLGTTIGIVSVYDNGFLPNNAFSKIHGLNFVGAGVTVEVPSIDFIGDVGIATIRIAVNDILNQGEVGQVLFNTTAGIVGGASEFYYDPNAGRVGIGTTEPNEKLDVLGNINVSENLISSSAVIGVATITNLDADLIETTTSIIQTGIVTSLIVDSGIANTFFATNLEANNAYFESYQANSGIVTSLEVENLDVSGISTFTTTLASSVGINSASPQTSLDVLGDVKFIGSIELANGTGTAGQILISNDSSPASWGNLSEIIVGAANSISISNTNEDETYYLNISKGFDKITQVFVDVANLVYNPSTNNLGIGTTNPQSSLDVIGSINATDSIVVPEASIDNAIITSITSSNIEVENFNVSGFSTFNIALGNSVGINSTTPETLLDVLGDIKVIGSIQLENGAGTAGQILISNGSSPATWGNPSDTTVGSANSLSITNTNVAGNYYLNFSSEFDAITNIFVDANGLVYNPSTNNLGIGSTNPQYSIDVVGDAQVSGTLFVEEVISRGIDAQEITRSSSGFLTTNSLDPVVVDSIGITTFRSAKYVVQVTTNNALGLGNTLSIKNLSSGLDYFPGVYENVSLESVTGDGANALAEITVVPQFTLTPTASSGGVFTFTGTSTGIQTGQTLFFNNTLDALPIEQSKLTEIELTFAGIGYTTVPNFTIESPIIGGNPVPGVGNGVTATGVVNSMIVSDLEIAVGIATTAYPTVTLSGPAVGTTATGVVGVGVSELNLTQVGTGYTVSPNLLIPKVTDFSGIVGMGISEAGWQVFGGSDYSSAPTIDIIAENGIGSGAVIEADIDADPPNGLINFTIVNPGIGYTVPPTVEISGGGGSDATIVITTLITTNGIINNSGFGATTAIQSNDIIIDPVAGIGTGGVFEVEKIIPTNVVLTSVGSGYTSADLPVTATFSDETIVADVGLGVEEISITNVGLGYTVLPSITFDSPTLGIAQTATAISTKLGYPPLFNGPGFGGTEAVYYVIPLSPNTFSLSLSSDGDAIPLGYSIPPGTIASVGGIVDNVNITFAGSNYEVDDVLTATNFDSERIDTNIGVGFSFMVNQVVDNFQISDVFLLQTGGSGNTQAYVIENSGIADVINLGNFSAVISGQSAQLIFTPTFANNEIKFFRTAFVI